MRRRTNGSDASWTTTFDFATGIMYVKISGLIRRSDWIEIVKDGAAWGRRYGATRHLVDYGEASVALTVTDLYTRPALLESSEVPRRWRVALVFSEAFASTHRAFIENVAFNQGFKTSVFASVEQARRWLLKPDPAPAIGEVPSGRGGR